MRRAVVSGFTAGVSFVCGLVVAMVVMQHAEDRRTDGAR